MKKWIAAVLATAALMPIFAVATFAQAPWPTKPLKIIVMWPPGGAADIACRLLQQPLSEVIGQPVVVENKSGGGGVTGTEALARSPGDGHTIGMVISSHASNVALHAKLPYDALKDFKPPSSRGRPTSSRCILRRPTRAWPISSPRRRPNPAGCITSPPATAPPSTSASSR